MSRIHPSAIISDGAELAEDVAVGAFAFIGPEVSIGRGNVIHHHACIEGRTTLGADCEVFPFACLGMRSQDLKYRGGSPGLKIGTGNVFREFVTAHAATADGDETVIGNHNHLLAYTHIAHDCVLGDHIVMSNYAGLAGHVVIEDHVIFGAYAGAHQFCRIGAYSMVGAKSKLTQDLPPYLIVDGNPAEVRFFNRVGLERAGFSPEQMDRVKFAFRSLYRERLNRAQALERIKNHPDADTNELARVLEFAQVSERGFAPGRRD